MLYQTKRSSLYSRNSKNRTETPNGRPLSRFRNIFRSHWHHCLKSQRRSQCPLAGGLNRRRLYSFFFAAVAQPEKPPPQPCLRHLVRRGHRPHRPSRCVIFSGKNRSYRPNRPQFYHHRHCPAQWFFNHERALKTKSNQSLKTRKGKQKTKANHPENKIKTN